MSCIVANFTGKDLKNAYEVEDLTAKSQRVKINKI